MKTVVVADVFGEKLYGRYPSDGALCGENLREKVIIPALENGEIVTLDFSEVLATPSSFFEEALGGLVRKVSYDNAVAERIKIPEEVRGDVDSICEHLVKRVHLSSKSKFMQKKLDRIKDYMKIAADLIKEN